MERPPRIEKQRTFNAGRRNPTGRLRRQTSVIVERSENKKQPRGTSVQRPRRKLQSAPSTHNRNPKRTRSPQWQLLAAICTCTAIFAPPIGAYVFVVTRHMVTDATPNLILASLLFTYIGTVLKLVYKGKIGSSLTDIAERLLIRRGR